MAAQENVEQVKMEDGRTVAFAGKRKAIKSSDFVNGEVQVRIDFRNGVSKLYTVPASLVPQAACHGGEQKYGDSYAGVDTGVEDMILCTDKVQENLAKGDWSARVEGSGIAGTSIVARALVEYTGKSMEAIREWLKTRSKADKDALRDATKPNKDGVSMRAIVERLEAEKKAKAQKVDTSALFADLGA